MSDYDLLCQTCNHYPPQQPGSWMCDTCRDRLHANLHTILGSHETPGLAHELDLELTGQTRKTSRSRVTTPTPAMPVNLAASDCLTHIRWALLSGCTLVAGSFPPVPNTIPDLAEWILAHEGQFALISGCGPIADNIDQLVHQAQRIIDNPPERIYVGTCPCGTRLMAITGNERVRCRGCGSTYDAAESRDALLESVADQWLTIRDISALIGRKYQTVWSWAERGHIHSHPNNPRLFRLGDALAKGARLTTHRQTA